VGINNVIYMELFSGPKISNGKCGKTNNAGMIDRGSTVHEVMIYSNCKMFYVVFQHIKFYIVPVHNVLDFIF